MEEEHRLVKERMRKLEEIRALGVEPFPYSFHKSDHAAAVLARHKDLQPEEKTEDNVSVAGRIMTMRRMGKATFLHIQDESGRLQLYLRADDIGEKSYSLVRLLDIGDIIGAGGKVFCTKTGEVSVAVQELLLLSKSLRPLPEKYHGLQDTEMRYRERYLDLVMNPESRKVFVARPKMVSAIRSFLD
ncbi:MAG: OB-fold nucleic acid binding domain-containing protein, partial [Candidatus Woesearchaeota archaeon]